MVESVDTRDLKSLAFRGVPVQVWLRAPLKNDSSGSLAQSVEQRTFNPLVEGSNPSRPTNLKIKQAPKGVFLLSKFLKFTIKKSPT